MPGAGGLGLPTLDKSLFSFRKQDRNCTSPHPDDELTDSWEGISLPPALPPLGILNGSKSFVNILSHLEEPSTHDIPGNSEHESYGASIPVLQDYPTSSSETLQQRGTSLMETDTVENMGLVQEKVDPSTSTQIKTSKIPERQQSSTSSTSMSKRSDAFSINSRSSKSSMEDVPVKSTPHTSIDSDMAHSLATDFFAVGFQDTKLDLELTQRFSTISYTQPVNTNKPLPRAPSRTAKNDGTIDQRTSLSELDSAPIFRDLEHKDGAESGRSADSSDRSYPAHSPRIQSPTFSIPETQELQLVPPRRSSARLRVRSNQLKKQYTLKVSADMADQVILRILLNLSSISDLQSVALVNKGIYQVFRSHESDIVESVVRNASPPAWELRQLVRHEHKRSPFQMKAVQRDLAALRALQAFMLMKCNKLCRKSTLEGLAGENPGRRIEIEDALWRIWTFCKLFGKGSSRDAGIHTQAMWLEGISSAVKGDRASMRSSIGSKGISRPQLEDMSEMWRCMETLLSGFRGREPEAREAGIFDQCEIDGKDSKTETQYLEDWIYDVLSVGPKAVLTMISCSFEDAKVLGVNRWTPPRPGRSRRSFFKTALEQVYRDRLVEEARHKADDFARSMHQQLSNNKRSYSTVNSPNTLLPSSAKQSRIRSETPKLLVDEKPTSPRLEIRPDCDPESQMSPVEHQVPATSPTTNPSAFSSIAMMSSASTRLGPTLFPIEHRVVSPTEGHPSASLQGDSDDSLDLDLEPRVIDPIDRAMSLLVKQLGFPAKLAKQALAMSDDGAGIDVQRAIELLSEDRRLEARPRDTQIVELPGTVPKTQATVQQFKEYCEGTCRRVSVVQRRKSNIRGLLNRGSFRQSFPLSVIMDRDEEEGAVQQLAKQAIATNVPISMPFAQTNHSEPKTGYQQFTNFLRQRNSFRQQSDGRYQHELVRGHKKSSSTGTVEFSDSNSDHFTSPISPISPALGLGGFTAIRPQSEIIHESEHENEQSESVVVRPKATLTRVGTGKKPSKRMSLLRHGLKRQGEPPEIIGYIY